MSRGTTPKSRKGAAAGLPASVPQIAAAPELFERAAELLTEEGLANAYVELLESLERGGTRDEVSAMTARKHVLGAFSDLQKARAERSAVSDMLRELQETQRLMKSQQGNASTSFSDRPPIPREDGRDPN